MFVVYLYYQEEQKAILQAEKIRIALEKIKEAKIKKVGSLGYTVYHAKVTS